MVSCEGMAIFGYSNEFRHVILNIVNNAMDAIIAGRTGNPVRKQQPGQIKFDFFHADPTLIINIADNGGGIDVENIHRIFEPYFTTKDPDKGTGLGLYMSKVIMEHMDGRLSVENNDRGAVFTLELPAWVQTAEENRMVK